MKTLKLTIATDSYWPQKGGVELTSLYLASGLKQNYNIQIITHGYIWSRSLFNSFNTVKKYPAKDPYGTPINHLKNRLLQNIILLPLLLWNIPKLKRAAVYDLLYFFYALAFKAKIRSLIADSNIVHCISTGYLARCISSICKDKNITLIHSPPIHFGRWGDSPAQLRSYLMSNALTCPTESFKRTLTELNATGVHKKIMVIPPVVEDPVFHKTVNEEFLNEKYVLFLGRREKHKGLKNLLSAFNSLKSYGRLIIAGPGEKIKSDSDCIIDIGEVDDAYKQQLLCFCTLLCVPSTNESFGAVYVEAMSYGKPVVALDISPTNEIIKNGKTGILVSPDDINSLQNAIRELLTDDDLNGEMGRSARSYYNEHFSKKHILQQYMNLYFNISS